MPKVRDGGREEQPHVQGVVAVWVQEGQEELFHIQGQEGRLWGDTPIQGKEQQTTSVFLPWEPQEQ